jgi:signal transduction histidine kinase
MKANHRSDLKRNLPESAAAVWMAAFDAFSDFVSIEDNDNSVLYVNKALAGALEKKPADLVGLKFDDLLREIKSTPPDYPANDNGKVGPSLATIYSRKLRKNLEISAFTVSTGEGPDRDIVRIWHDTTDANHFQDKLELRYKRELSLRKKLQDEINRRADFVNALVHEIRTPLTPILASSEILYDTLKEEPYKSLARNIHRGAIMLNDRVDELMELARVESGTIKLRIYPVDLHQLIQDVMQYMTPLTNIADQSLTMNMPGKALMIEADGPRIKQVLLNLVTNASKYSPRGAKINVRTRKQTGGVVVVVQDNGPGISPDLLNLVFEPYNHKKKSLLNPSGLGLGLPLSKSLIELHGGTMQVVSQVGKGSTFSFFLPLKYSGTGADS